MAFVKDKFKDEATDYQGGIISLNKSLTSVTTSLENVDKILGLDPENSKDILSYNVIISNQEIKDEIRELTMDLDIYSSLVMNKAIEIDNIKEEEERQRLALLASEADEKSDSDKEGEV
jgi:hypothetical protein